MPKRKAPAHVRRDEAKVEKRVAAMHGWSSAALVGQTVTINRPRAEIYQFWRDFTNLPKIMENIEGISILDNHRSEWQVKGPGGPVSWQAIVTEDQPDRLIAWESAPGADIRHSGAVEFRDAPAGRGSWVRATFAYEPPAGALGEVIAKLWQKEPQIQARRDLRRLKQFLETGEIATSAAARDAAS